MGELFLLWRQLALLWFFFIILWLIFIIFGCSFERDMIYYSYCNTMERKVRFYENETEAETNI